MATIRADGSPDVVPVGYRFKADGTIDIGGPNMGSSQKYRNVQRDPRAAFVVDDTTPDQESDFRPRALVFPGVMGGPLRRGNFNRMSAWPYAVKSIGAEGLHFHDLRHTGNTFAEGRGVALDASFPGKREDGAVRDQRLSSPTPHAAPGEKPQVSMVV